MPEPATTVAYVLPWWMQWAQATALIVISCLGSWIAFKQARIAAAKLNLDLYDKRFKVFEAGRHFLGQFLVHGTIRLQEITELSVGTADAVFLFGDEVVEYLDGLRKTGVSLNGKNTRLRNMGDNDPERNAVVDQIAALETQLSVEVPRITSLFKPYLKLGNI
jgi:hypothetical protein